MIRKRTLYIVVALALSVGFFGLWYYRSAQSMRSFVEEWSLSFQRAEERCRLGGARIAIDCAHWAAHAPIYNAAQFAELEEWLTPACRQGRQMDCQRLEKIAAARSDNSSPWLLGTAENSGFSGWPKIKNASASMSSSDWLNNALQGAVAGAQSAVDLYCGNLSEIKETLVCTTSNQMKLNLSIGRVVSYVEQNRRIDSYKEHEENPLNRFWQGVDLQREDFDSAVKVLRQRGSLAPEEERLWSWLEARPWKVFLAFNVYSVFTGIPSHEFLHALYFSSPEFRSATRSVIENHSTQLQNLSQFVERLYKTPERFILSNEKQAYLLEHNSSFRDVEGEGVIAQILDALPLGFDRSIITQLQQGY